MRWFSSFTVPCQAPHMRCWLKDPSFRLSSSLDKDVITLVPKLRHLQLSHSGRPKAEKVKTLQSKDKVIKRFLNVLWLDTWFLLKVVKMAGMQEHAQQKMAGMDWVNWQQNWGCKIIKISWRHYCRGRIKVFVFFAIPLLGLCVSPFTLGFRHCTLRDSSSLKCRVCSQLHSAFVGFRCLPCLYVSGPLDFRLVIQVLLSPRMILNACVCRLHPCFTSLAEDVALL